MVGNKRGAEPRRGDLTRNIHDLGDRQDEGCGGWASFAGGRSGNGSIAAATPMRPPSDVSQARAVSRVSECPPAAASVRIKARSWRLKPTRAPAPPVTRPGGALRNRFQRMPCPSITPCPHLDYTQVPARRRGRRSGVALY